MARNIYLHKFVLQHDIPPGTRSPQWRYFLVEKYDSHQGMRYKCLFHLVNCQACMFLVDKLLSKTRQGKHFRILHFTASIIFQVWCFTFFTFFCSSSYNQCHLQQEHYLLIGWTKPHSLKVSPASAWGLQWSPWITSFKRYLIPENKSNFHW